VVAPDVTSCVAGAGRQYYLYELNASDSIDKPHSVSTITTKARRPARPRPWASSLLWLRTRACCADRVGIPAQPTRSGSSSAAEQPNGPCAPS